jgi:hypothetical protein
MAVLHELEAKTYKAESIPSLLQHRGRWDFTLPSLLALSSYKEHPLLYQTPPSVTNTPFCSKYPLLYETAPSVTNTPFRTNQPLLYQPPPPPPQCTPPPTWQPSHQHANVLGDLHSVPRRTTAIRADGNDAVKGAICRLEGALQTTVDKTASHEPFCFCWHYAAMPRHCTNPCLYMSK